MSGFPPSSPLPPSLFPAVFLILYRLLCPATSISTTTTTSSDHDYDRRRPRLRPAATTTAVLSGSPCLQRSTKVSEFYWQAQSSALQKSGPRHSDGNIKMERRRRDRFWCNTCFCIFWCNTCFCIFSLNLKAPPFRMAGPVTVMAI